MVFRSVRVLSRILISGFGQKSDVSIAACHTVFTLLSVLVWGVFLTAAVFRVTNQHFRHSVGIQNKRANAFAPAKGASWPMSMFTRLSASYSLTHAYAKSGVQK